MRRTMLCAAALLAVAAPAAHAATIKVTTTADTLAAGGGCSLRAAVIASNTDSATGGCRAGSGADVIKLKDTTYTFTLAGPNEDASATGDLDITSAITIKGKGATIDANELDGVLDVRPGGNLTLTNATLTGGSPYPAHTEPRSRGITIRNDGTATLSQVAIVNNHVGGDGDLVENTGTFTLSGSTVADNVVQPPVFRDDAGPQGIVNVGTLVIHGTVLRDGIANVLNARGAATITDSQISGSVGGAIVNQASMQLTRSTVSDNDAGDPAFSAAGIVNAGELWIRDSTVSDNSAVSGNDPHLIDFTGVKGAGISNQGTLHLAGSTVSGNTLTQHCTSSSDPRCNQGLGAGIANSGTLDITNATVAGNTLDFACTDTGDPGDPTCPTDGGAGIANFGGGTLIAIALTLADNHGGVAGGGVAIFGGSVSLIDSVVADNTVDAGGTGPDCSGHLAALSYSLLGDSDGCTIGGIPGSLLDVDPLLGPLQDNGGPTFTMALDPSSAAVDSGPARRRQGCPKTDQRGIQRPQGAGCDMGAYELTER